MAIKCCNGCVPPKRNPTCHGSCPDYIKEKAEHDARMEEDYKRRRVNRNLNEQRYDAITKAVKGKRKCKEERS